MKTNLKSFLLQNSNNFFFFILAQMWQYNSGLRTLDNKNGNWKYLHVHWTLPLKDETEKMHIETIDGEVLGINNDDEIVLQNVTYSLGELL